QAPSAPTIPTGSTSMRSLLTLPKFPGSGSRRVTPLPKLSMRSSRNGPYSASTAGEAPSRLPALFVFDELTRKPGKPALELNDRFRADRPNCNVEVSERSSGRFFGVARSLLGVLACALLVPLVVGFIFRLFPHLEPAFVRTERGTLVFSIG